MISSLGSPTLRAHTLIQQNVSSIKERLEVVRSEAVTGRIDDVARAVGGDTAKVSLLQDSINYSEDRADVLRFESDRMSAAQSSIDAIRGQSSIVVDALRFGESAPGALTIAQNAAIGGLDDTVARLNGSFGGRPLFGGDTGVAPISGSDEIINAVRTIVAAAPDATTALADVQSWFDDPAGGFQATVYQGGNDAPTVEIDKGDRVATSLRADDVAFRDLLRGFAIAAVASDAPNDTTRTALFSEADSILSNASEAAIGIQASLGVNEERVFNAVADHEAKSTSLSIAYNGLTTRDQAEAATEMRLLESQLEAAYLTTSRMANLSLLNYLR